MTGTGEGENSSAPGRGCPVVDFDHHGPEHNADRVGSYRRLRETAPVVWTESHGGFYVVTDYDGVFHAARHPEIYSSARSSVGGEGLATTIPKAPVHLHIPVELDPPDHRVYRKLLNPMLTPSAVDSMRERVEELTDSFIDEMIESGSGDFASVIGVPAAVTIDWLGLPVADWPRYSAAHHAVISEGPGSDGFAKALEVDFPWMNEQIQEAIVDRRATPRKDMISYLVCQEVGGRPITDDEVFSIVELLISGGVGTTASLVSQTLVYLDQDRELRQRLIENPDSMEKAVEEFLRAFSPTQALARTVVADDVVSGCPVRAGDRVLISWSAANRDPSHFDNPDSVNVDRWPNRHLAFGAGVHRCAGAHLARLMARTMLGKVLTRMPDYSVDPAGLSPYYSHGVNAGWRTIPVTFTPGARKRDVTAQQL